MKQSTAPARNRPTEEGRRNDPNLRDEDARQPGIQTNSPSKYDDENQRVTHSAMDGAHLTEFDLDTNADATFDEIDGEDDSE